MSDDTRTTRRAVNLFDLRRIIGGVFVVYGILLAILGLFDSQEEIDRAAGVNINLWVGLGMLVFGILMFTWALTRPLSEELGHASASEEPGGPPRPSGERASGDVGAGPQQGEH